MLTFKYMMLYETLTVRSRCQLLAQQVTSLNKTTNKTILRKLLCVPRPAYSFCYAPVNYLIEYALTFTLRHGNSLPSTHSQ